MLKRVLIFSLVISALCSAAGAKNKVFVLEIRAEIDPRMSRYVSMALEEAGKQNADFVVVDMDTYGGAVDDADKIRTALLEYPKPVFVYINKNAASAGALIAIACDSIYMEKGSSIGAATVVNGSDGMPVPEKYQSYMRSMMRSTAEANHRNPLLAEAFVDPDVTLDSAIKKNGKVLTLTTSEAIENGFCEAEVTSLNDILQKNNLVDSEIIKFEISASEKIIAFFLNPAISGVLILIMIGGIWFELQTPGVGFPLIAAIVAAVLYFTPYYLNGLAQNWEILMFIIGLILLGVEIFVIPGFGVVGIMGIIFIFSSLILSMLNNDLFDFEYVKPGDLYYSMLSVLVSFVATIVLVIIGGNRMLKSDYFKKISLHDKTILPVPVESSQKINISGMQGTAHTVLRPSGKIEVEGEVYDAFTTGEFIEKGDFIVVVSEFNNSWKVKKA